MNLDEIEQLAREGKYETALQEIAGRDWEGVGELESLQFMTLKSKCLVSIGKFEEALKVAKDVAEERKSSLTFPATKKKESTPFVQKKGIINRFTSRLLAFIGASKDSPLFKSDKARIRIDAYIIMAEALRRLGRFDDALGSLDDGDSIIKTLTDQSPEDKKREASLLGNKAILFWRKGELDQALENNTQSMMIREEIGNKPGLAQTYNTQGLIFQMKGELNQALDYFDKSAKVCEELGNIQHQAYILGNIGELYIHKGDLEHALVTFQHCYSIFEKIGNKQDIAEAERHIGLIYHGKGDLDLAINFLRKSLKLRTELKNNTEMSDTLFYLIIVSLDMENLDQAQMYLEQLKSCDTREKNKLINQRYRLANALVLKTSKRAKNIGKAQELLEQIANEEIVQHRLTVIALLNLFELLLQELQSSGEEEILEETKTIAKKLLVIAKEQHSFSLLAETYWLQAQLALVELDLKKARSLLNEAQLLADENGLDRLAQKISSEYDTLLDHLNQWEELIEKDASLTERVKVARLEELVTTMRYDKEIEIQDEIDEEPVQLMILQEKSGIPLFSQSFKPEFDVDNLLMGGLLTAVRSFTNELFSQSLDRLRIGEYTVIITPVSSSMICYVFKGSSYSAQHKVIEFTEGIQSSSALQNMLKSTDESLIVDTKAFEETLMETSLLNIFTNKI